MTDQLLGGSHDWKVGVQYTGHGSDNLTGPNDTYLTYSVTGRPTTGTTQLPYHQGADGAGHGAVCRRHLPAGRAVVNCGVRYDYSKGSFPSLAVAQRAGPADRRDVGGQRRRLSLEHGVAARRRQLSGERLGQDASLKAHYGRYYKALEAGEFRPAVPSITPAYSFTLDAAGNRTNIVQISSNANLRIDPNFKSAYNDQFIVQLEQQLIDGPGPAGELRPQERRGLRRLAGHRRPVRAGAVRRQRRHRRDRRDGDGLSPDQRSGRAASSCRPIPDGLYMRYNGVTMMAHQAHGATTGRACSRWCCRNRKDGSARARASRRPRAEQPGRARSAATPRDPTTSSTPTAC